MYITCAGLSDKHAQTQTDTRAFCPPTAPSAPVWQCRLSHSYRVDKHRSQQHPLPPAQQLVEGEAKGRQQALLPHLGSAALAVGGTLLPLGDPCLPIGAGVTLCFGLRTSPYLLTVDSFGCGGVPCLLAAVCQGGRADFQRGQRKCEAFAFL